MGGERGSFQREKVERVLEGVERWRRICPLDAGTGSSTKKSKLVNC